MRRALTLSLLLLLLPVPSPAVENLGAHRFRGMGEFERVLDRRCTVCHTRERVDDAVRTRRNVEYIQKRMLEQGAVLSVRDKAVLGTFWGAPMKK